MTDEELEHRIAACLDAPGEVSGRARADELAHTYLALDRETRQRLLEILAERFGAARSSIDLAIERLSTTSAGAERIAAERALRDALRPPWHRLLTQLNAVSGGVKFLVDLRADLLAIASRSPELGALEEELKALLRSWFDVGFLELQRITWESSAALLEKLIAYEAVHEIRSWDDLRNRLDSDRRCYAFFHPAMPHEPLAFVEVALVSGLSANVQRLLDESAPLDDPRHADTAIFYSISNTQRGLRGISFGEHLIKRVVAELGHELPRLTTFATLSPIPGLRVWLDARLSEAGDAMLLAGERERIARLDPGFGASLREILAQPDWQASQPVSEAVTEPLVRLCTRYLLERHTDGQPIDPVARFHLRNGATVERINWMADTSRKGMRQSHGLMVNYGYELDGIDARQQAYEKGRHVTVSSDVQELLDRADAPAHSPSRRSIRRA